MPTKQGCSGSPILARHEGNYYAIGIHTHKGRANNYNSAVYFDVDFLKDIEKFNQKMI